jgi:hypothetical protein
LHRQKEQNSSLMAMQILCLMNKKDRENEKENNETAEAD